MDLKGVVALVAGGNGGLGQRICQALAQAGADVAVTYPFSQQNVLESAKN
jgi:3-oxoacyl-[acyl-carrier protein] reductase